MKNYETKSLDKNYKENVKALIHILKSHKLGLFDLSDLLKCAVFLLYKDIAYRNPFKDRVSGLYDDKEG